MGTQPERRSGPRPETGGTPPVLDKVFGGWANDSTSPIGHVRIAIDGTSFGEAQYGGLRTDVCGAGTLPGCPNVGWRIAINTASLANGSHVFTATAFTTDSTARETSREVVFVASNATVATPNQSTVTIDTPSWQGVYFGQVSLGGWITDSRSTIARVNVAIDGVSYGAAIYGFARGDACGVVKPGCPNVGWGYALDTSELPDGSHTLSVTAFTSDATPRVSTALIELNVNNSNIPNMDIDTPPAGHAAYSGTVGFGGWTVDTTNLIGAVNIAIDGNSYGEAAWGGTRTDVCAAGSMPGCPNVGWNFGINTAELSNGTHTLTVTAFTAEDVPRLSTQNRTFTVANSNPSAQNTSQVSIGIPHAQVTYSGAVGFGGWALDNTSAIQSVSIAIDGISYGSAAYGNTRVDVCDAFPGRPGCPNVGWTFLFDTARLDDGAHTLTVTVLTKDSVPRQTTSTTSFTTDNSFIAGVRWPWETLEHPATAHQVNAVAKSIARTAGEE